MPPCCGSVRTGLRQPPLITSHRRRAVGSRLNLHESSRGRDGLHFELWTRLGWKNCQRQQGAKLPKQAHLHVAYKWYLSGIRMVLRWYLCILQLHQDPCHILQMSTPDKMNRMNPVKNCVRLTVQRNTEHTGRTNYFIIAFLERPIQLLQLLQLYAVEITAGPDLTNITHEGVQSW